MTRRVVAILAALVVTLWTARAVAEPDPELGPIHLTVPTTVTDGEGNSLDLPPGYFLTEDKWDALDLEVQRLQERETRLGAENRSLRDSASPTWWKVAIGFAAGAAAGYAITRL